MKLSISATVTRFSSVRNCNHKILALLAACSPLLAMSLGCASGTTISSITGTVSATANPQVAVYTITAPRTATVTVDFGKTTDYELQTSTKQTHLGGGTISIDVAGMQANTTYHMQAVAEYGDGTIVKDADHTFTTGSYPAASLPSVTVVTTPGQTPQPGIEILNPVGPGLQIAALDLSGNIIWAYNPNMQMNGATWLAPKLMENGDFIAVASVASSTALVMSSPPGAPNLVREFDLAGNTVKEITMDQLNSELADAGYNVTLSLFSHDVTVLPNGHWLVLTNTLKNVVLQGQTTPTQVLGDVIVDLDTDLKPVWVWNEFDHLDVNRHPWIFPDWTHTNAVIYTPEDGNLLVSIRHQNWIVKVGYYNGTGTGNILWHLGQGGDFTLIGGTDPPDWSYAQHRMAITTPNSAGIFGLAVMDNGNDRMYPGDTTIAVTCGVNGAPACYSSIPVYEINESTMTATVQFHQILPANLYSFFGGNASVLKNGHIEYDLCGLLSGQSQAFEVTNDPNPQTVWNLTLNHNFAYRAYRLPSLYPGVQW